MADTVLNTTVFDGSKKLITHYNVVSDNSGSTTKIVDVSALNSSPANKTCKTVRLNKISFNVSVTAQVDALRMLWDATTDVAFQTLNGEMEYDYSSFGGLPNTSFSQNVGIVGMTGVMSRHVVTIGAIVLVVCGLIPKIGAIIASMPLPVLGGGVIVMFGMVAAAGLNVLSEVKLNRRNMVIIAVSLAVGLGLNLVPSAVQYLPGVVKVLATSAVAPTAIVAVILNLVLPEED